MEGRGGEELSALFARLEDLSARAGGGEVAVTDFLSPRELHYAEGYLRRLGVAFGAYGGYGEAERRCLYLLPDYMESGGEDLSALLSTFEVDTGISALSIRGSGYRTLSHRDFLGSLLGLGLSRAVLGDIAVDTEGREAILFCRTSISEFLLTELSAVGSDKVRVRRLNIEEVSIPPRRYETLSDTVASARLDGVVAALCGLSRERARQTVVSGLVELNYESEERPDRTVSEGALLSVRGMGKYRILSLSDRTKKGRLRLTAEKYL